MTRRSFHAALLAIASALGFGHAKASKLRFVYISASPVAVDKVDVALRHEGEEIAASVIAFGVGLDEYDPIETMTYRRETVDLCVMTGNEPLVLRGRFKQCAITRGRAWAKWSFEFEGTAK